MKLEWTSAEIDKAQSLSAFYGYWYNLYQYLLFIHKELNDNNNLLNGEQKVTLSYCV